MFRSFLKFFFFFCGQMFGELKVLSIARFESPFEGSMKCHLGKSPLARCFVELGQLVDYTYNDLF